MPFNGIAHRSQTSRIESYAVGSTMLGPEEPQRADYIPQLESVRDAVPAVDSIQFQIQSRHEGAFPLPTDHRLKLDGVILRDL
jgi:hypothetical protein